MEIVRPRERLIAFRARMRRARLVTRSTTPYRCVGVSRRSDIAPMDLIFLATPGLLGIRFMSVLGGELILIDAGVHDNA